MTSEDAEAPAAAEPRRERAASAPLLEASALAYRYDDGTEALAGVRFVLAEGERVGVVGSNGAGKSTLLLLLSGLVEPSAGVVRVRGEPAAEAARRGLALVFQDPDDMLFMTRVLDDVAFGPRQSGLGEAEARARAERALEAVGMPAARFGDRVPFALSRGQKSRVAIACALALEPAALLLDEPSASLDPRARRQLVDLLERLPAALVVATHDLALVRRLCSRVVVLDAGRVVAEGPCASVLADEALLDRHGLWGLEERSKGAP